MPELPHVTAVAGLPVLFVPPVLPVLPVLYVAPDAADMMEPDVFGARIRTAAGSEAITWAQDASSRAARVFASAWLAAAGVAACGSRAAQCATAQIW